MDSDESERSPRPPKRSGPAAGAPAVLIRMTPPKQFFRALPAALSLLLCVVVLVMWVRSHLVYEQFGRITPDHGAKIIRSASGRLHFACHSYWDHTFSMNGEWSHHVGVQAPSGWPQREYQRPANETLGFARYVGTAYTWPAHLHPDVPYNPPPPKTDPRWWRDNYRVWVIPHWFLFLVTAALPAWWRKRHPPATWPSPLARRRRAAGLCPKCAYDLRATPGRCPECGTPFGRDHPR